MIAGLLQKVRNSSEIADCTSQAAMTYIYRWDRRPQRPALQGAGARHNEQLLRRVRGRLHHGHQPERAEKGLGARGYCAVIQERKAPQPFSVSTMSR